MPVRSAVPRGGRGNKSAACSAALSPFESVIQKARPRRKSERQAPAALNATCSMPHVAAEVVFSFTQMLSDVARANAAARRENSSEDSAHTSVLWLLAAQASALSASSFVSLPRRRRALSLSCSFPLCAYRCAQEAPVISSLTRERRLQRFRYEPTRRGFHDISTFPHA